MIVGLTYFHFNPRSRAGSDFNPATHYKNNRTFQSTLPCRERRSFTAAYLSTCIFQSTLPCRERQHFSYRTTEDEYFNPRSRAGSDCASPVPAFRPSVFQSTLPCRERLGSEQRMITYEVFQSTLPCRERPRPQGLWRFPIYISIHAPVQGATAIVTILPHFSIFQSTLPCRERQQKHTNNQFNFLII